MAALLGATGENTLSGGDGNDLWSGGARNDVLHGGAGTDAQIVGSCHEQLTGTVADGSVFTVFDGPELGNDGVTDSNVSECVIVLVASPQLPVSGISWSGIRERKERAPAASCIARLSCARQPSTGQTCGSVDPEDITAAERIAFFMRWKT